jgi:alkanesulfonate monooxygenase SsuD/methylene tetrahydromethanopterin reductase-like flavin-dependent oxidoreductase (luciferase family)
MSIDTDGTRARDTVKRRLAFLIEHSYAPDPAHWEQVAELGEFDLEDFASILRRLRDGEEPESAIGDQFVDSFAVAGTPHACADLIKEYRAAGTTEIVALLASWSDVESQITHIATSLIPAWGGT